MNRKELLDYPAFCRDVWLLCDHKAFSDITSDEFECSVRELAHDYGLEDGIIWDLMPEIYKGIV